VPVFAVTNPVGVSFDEETTRWRMSNGVVEASFQLTAEGAFQFQEFRELRSGESWKQPPGRSSGLFRFRIGDQWWDGEKTRTAEDTGIPLFCMTFPGGWK
jgi:hypothetical protein